MTGIKADRRAKELAIPYGHDVTGSQVDRHTLLRGHGCRSVREGLAPPATADLCRLSGWTEAHPYGVTKLFGGGAIEADSALQKKSWVQLRNLA